MKFAPSFVAPFIVLSLGLGACVINQEKPANSTPEATPEAPATAAPTAAATDDAAPTGTDTATGPATTPEPPKKKGSGLIQKPKAPAPTDTPPADSAAPPADSATPPATTP